MFFPFLCQKERFGHPGIHSKCSSGRIAMDSSSSGDFERWSGAGATLMEIRNTGCHRPGTSFEPQLDLNGRCEHTSETDTNETTEWLVRDSQRSRPELERVILTEGFLPGVHTRRVTRQHMAPCPGNFIHSALSLGVLHSARWF